jgi:hypothetical protein
MLTPLCYQGFPRGKSVASASTVASRNQAIINDPGTGPTWETQGRGVIGVGGLA